MNTFLRIYRDLHNYGTEVRPRGEKIVEIENYQATFQPFERFSSFGARGFNVGYCIREFLWYLRGDRYDDSIAEYATMWKKLKDVDGGYNSNYGQYMFGDENQVQWVVEELMRDKDSRRAAMVLLQNNHLRANNVDVVCTYGLSFRIRENCLNMSVSMRSNDAIFGLTNDAFCFSMIHEYVWQALRAAGYSDLLMGTYTHKVDSLHVYERHYEMLDQLVEEGMNGFTHMSMPVTYDIGEFAFMLDAIGPTRAQWERIKAAPQYATTRWMYDRLYRRVAP